MFRSLMTASKAFLSLGALFGVAAFAVPASAETASMAAASASDSFRMPVTKEGSLENPLGEEDGRFKSLFASWDRPSVAGSAESYIPSLKPVEEITMTSRYGYRTDPFRGRRANHKGVDFAGPVGTPIYATADGIVGRAQWVGGYGRYVEIEHGSGLQTRYGHMSRLAVEANQRVKRGQIIGYMGSTGRSTGSHLHYEVRVAGEPVNPMIFLESSNYLLAAQERGTEALGGPAE